MERIRLLVVQPTKLCNLNCSYCYLPNRHRRDVMSRAVVEGICRNILTSRFVGPELEVSLHGGEPLAAGVEWFKDFVSALEENKPSRTQIRLSLQTNATLINSEWIELIRAHSVAVGVSLDGPPALNLKRQNWSGRPSFKHTIEGVRRLRAHNIPFSVLSVLHEESVRRPDELFHFLRELAPKRVSFNVEEQEGANVQSSLAAKNSKESLKNFWRRFWDLSEQYNFPFEVREFSHMAHVIAGLLEGDKILNHVAEAVCCVSVATDGDYCTFAPELLEMDYALLGNFIVGNVYQDRLDDAILSVKFRQINSSVSRGIAACAETCLYFKFCGGGSPSNKYSEFGDLSATETAYCRNGIQSLVDVALERAVAGIV